MELGMDGLRMSNKEQTMATMMQGMGVDRAAKLDNQLTMIERKDSKEVGMTKTLALINLSNPMTKLVPTMSVLASRILPLRQTLPSILPRFLHLCLHAVPEIPSLNHMRLVPAENNVAITSDKKLFRQVKSLHRAQKEMWTGIQLQGIHFVKIWKFPQ